MSFCRLTRKKRGRDDCHATSLLDLAGPLGPVFFCLEYGGCPALCGLGCRETMQERPHVLHPRHMEHQLGSLA